MPLLPLPGFGTWCNNQTSWGPPPEVRRQETLESNWLICWTTKAKIPKVPRTIELNALYQPQKINVAF
jgi:hypothetical protein